VDFRAGLEDLEKKKFFTLPEFELDPSVVQPIASRYTGSSFRAFYISDSEAGGNTFL
jgi:hypothetical protein